MFANASHGALRSTAIVAALAMLSMVLGSPVRAGIATDGSVGPVQDLSGPSFVIPEALGTRTGDNLFHSFRIFDIFRGESATFTGASDIANVISRVTGGNVSTIDGLLRSRVGRADFYFINPAGVLFGANARIDVPAAFHVSTAETLQFADGSQYNAIDPAASTLTIAPPQAFGFLGTRNATIAVDAGELRFAPGSSVSLAAGELVIQGGQLVSEGGEVRLTAMGRTAGSVPLGGAAPAAASGRFDAVSARVDVSGDGGGSLVVRAGEAKFSDSHFFADNSGSRHATRGIDAASESLVLDSGSLVTADALGNGNAGPVRVSVKEALEIRNGSAVASLTTAGGNAGTIAVEAGQLVLDGNGIEASIFTITGEGSTGKAGAVEVKANDRMEILDGGLISSGTLSSGDAGTVTVKAGQLLIDGQGSGLVTGILNSAEGDFSGSAGATNVTVDGGMELLGGGAITSNTSSKGDAGTITVEAGQLRIDGQGTGLVTGISNTTAGEFSGNAGTVEVTVAGGMELLEGGTISSRTLSKGDAATVTVDVGNTLEILDGSLIGSNTFGDGNAGATNVTVDGGLELLRGGTIRSDTFSKGDAGAVQVEAGQIRIDGQGAAFLTGIASDADGGASGNAGDVQVTVTEMLETLNGGKVRSSTFSEGNAGTVTVKAGQLLIDGQGSDLFTGIGSTAEREISGNAGSVEVTVEGALELLGGGKISSSTFSKGDAGEVRMKAGQLLIDGQGSEFFTGISSTSEKEFSGNAGTVEVTVAGGMKLLGGGKISSSTFSKGNAGAVQVEAGQLRIDRQGSSSFTGIVSDASSDSSGRGGNIQVTVDGALQILGGGQIRSDTFSTGDAGSVRVAAGRLLVDRMGTDSFTGISSDANGGSSGHAGEIQVTVDETLQILGGGSISSSAFSTGDAGTVTVEAGRLTIDRGTSGLFTGIASDASSDSSGRGGNIQVTVDGALQILGGGQIRSDTFSTGDAGSVRVEAGQLLINGQGSTFFTGISSDANAGASGNAGDVQVTTTDTLEILNGSAISSSTFAEGNAGTVIVEAGQIVIDGLEVGAGILSAAGEDSSGNAGTVEVITDGSLEIRNGGISSSTFSTGDAGTVKVDTNGTLRLIDAGAIGSSTFGAGDAGSVILAAAQLQMDGPDTVIAARAFEDSSGQVGNVAITARDVQLDHGAAISIESRPFVSDPGSGAAGNTTLAIDASRIDLSNGGRISAESFGNVPASDIVIDVSKRLTVTDARIATSANEADGGTIQIDGGDIILANGLITTSVAGTGERLAGGDIRVTADALAMNTGFIQANSNSPGGSGGTILIDTPALIASRDLLLIGGEERQAFRSGVEGLNVIQAVAPEGVSGTVNVTSPNLDISGTLVPLSTRFVDIAELVADPCATRRGRGYSSLSGAGYGGLPAEAGDAQSISFATAALEEVMGRAANSAQPGARSAADRNAPNAEQESERRSRARRFDIRCSDPLPE